MAQSQCEIPIPPRPQGQNPPVAESGARSFSVTFQPTKLARASGSISRHAPVTDNTHQELAEAIVQFLDVSEDAHESVVLTVSTARRRAALFVDPHLDRAEFLDRLEQHFAIFFDVLA